MGYRQIGSSWDSRMREDIDLMFIELYKEYTGAGLDATEAKEKSLQAVADALIAKEDAATAKEMVQQIIDGEVDTGALVLEIERKLNELESQYAPDLNGLKTEVGEARGNEATLGDNLNSIKTDLAQTETKVDEGFISVNTDLTQTRFRALNYTKYGKVWYPPKYVDFLNSMLPFVLYRDFDGIIKHDFDITDYIPETKVYWRQYNAYDPKAADSNDGLSSDTPVISWERVIEIVNSLSAVGVTIVFMDEYVRADQMLNFTIPQNKNIALQSYLDGGSYIGTISTYFGWTADGDLYKTNRTSARKVFDYAKKDRFGSPREMPQANSIVECQELKGSWYTDGTSVWVNREIPNTSPYSEIGIMLQLAYNGIFDLGNQDFIIDNVHFWTHHSGSTNLDSLSVSGTQGSRVFINNSSLRGGSRNGFSMVGVGASYLFDCSSLGNALDGFNYHGDGDEFVFEYNCYAANNGDETQGSANATTAHDGMTIVRVGTIGEDCYGALLADVGDCVSINYDCRMYNNLVTREGVVPAAFHFNGGGTATEPEQWLINCEGGGDNTYTVVAQSKPPKIINLKGINVDPNTTLEYIEFT